MMRLVWQVTTLLNSVDEVLAQPQHSEADLTALREALTAQGEAVKAIKAVRALSVCTTVGTPQTKSRGHDLSAQVHCCGLRPGLSRGSMNGCHS